MTSAPVITIAEPIALNTAPPPDGEMWTHPRREYFSELFGTEAVVNVAAATLTPVLPADGCGTALIVAPGGGFHGLSINSEGYDVARWLAARGVASFVLEYRLVPGGDDPVAEMFTKPGKQTAADMARVAVLAGADGIAAMQLVRSHATDFAVDATRVGIIGFSAGGNVALRVALADQAEDRPDFVAAIYAATRRARPHRRAPRQRTDVPRRRHRRPARTRRRFGRALPGVEARGPPCRAPPLCERRPRLRDASPITAVRHMDRPLRRLASDRARCSSPIDVDAVARRP